MSLFSQMKKKVTLKNAPDNTFFHLAKSSLFSKMKNRNLERLSWQNLFSTCS